MDHILDLFHLIKIGEDCESDLNSCDNEPCGNDRNCTDLSPTQELLQNRSYTCSECPAGYYANVDGKCTGNI